MTNFFDSKKVIGFTKEDVEIKLRCFVKLNEKVFDGIEDPTLKNMFSTLLEAQELALSTLFFGVKKNDLDEE